MFRIRHSTRRAATIIFSLAIGGPIPAQTIAFSRYFTTPGMNQATAVASNASGVYVFGTGPGPGGSVSSGVRKYDSNGNELWTRDFSSSAERFVTAAADPSGVYVIGLVSATSQTLVHKYSPDGDELWNRPVEVNAGALAVDGTGVYITGGDYQSVFLRKYSPDGAELWTNQFGATQTGTGIALDSTGVYLEIAYSNGAAGVTVRKYDSGGNEVWTRQLNPSDIHRTFAAADPTGFYLVAADARGSGTYLRKYDSGGNELWSSQVPENIGLQIAVNTTGVYVGGQVPATFPPYRPYAALPGHCQSGSGGDSFVRKYDSGGDELWTREFGTTDGEWAAGMAVDDSGVYVVGEEGTAQVQEDTEHVDAFAPANPTSDAFLVKLVSSTAAVTSSGPRIFADCVVNAASYLGGGVAPGEMVTIFGSAIGPSDPVQMLVADNHRLASTLAGTRVLFNGIPAPLQYVSYLQSSAIVPYEVAGQASVDVQVEFMGSLSAAVTVPVLPSRPGIFTVDGSGWGQAMILNEDGSLNSPSNPAQRGSVITLYGTGGGEVAPGVEDGEILSSALPQTSLPVWVFFDLTDNEFQVPSKAGEVLYSGGVSGSVAGLLQIKLRVPANTVSKGDAVPFLLIIGSHWTVYQVTVALQ